MSADTKYPFLQTGGEMGTLTRAYDWSKTALGAPASWSHSLRTQIQMMLTSRFPMLIFWGPELITFYNDAFRPSLGNDGKHPGSLGQRGEESWAESWPVIGPMIRDIMAGGEAVWFEDQKLPIYREGKMGYAYWTYSFSPLADDDGTVGGVLVTCSETTKAVESLQQVAESEQRFQNLVRDANVGIIVLTGDEARVSIVNDAYARLIGREAGALQGRNLFDVIPEAEPVFRPLIDGVRTGGEPLHLYNTPYTVNTEAGPKSGALNLVYQPYREVNGAITGVMVLCQDITDEVESRKEMERSEAKFRALIQESPVGTCLYVGRELRIEVANETILGYWGKGREVIGKTMLEVLPEMADQEFPKILDRVFTTGTAWEEKAVRAEVLVNGVRGTYYFDVTYKPLRNAAGEVYAILDMAVDVTAQVKASEALKASEARVRALIEESPVASCLFVGRDMRVAVANRQIVDIWGKGPDVIGKPLVEILPETAGQPFLEILDRVYTTGEPFAGQAAPATHVVDGQTVTKYFDFVYKALHDADGAIYGVMDVAIDVTERVVATQQLENNQRRLQTLFEQAPAAIAILEREGLTFRMANAAYCRIIGREPGAVLDRPLLEALPEVAGQGFDALLQTVMDTGVTHVAEEQPVQLVRNGTLETCYLDFSYSPMSEADGTVSGVFVVANDVTAQVTARMQIESSEAKFRALIEEAPFATALYVGDELRIDTANDAMIRLWGKTPAVVGTRLEEALPELEGQPFFGLLRDVLHTGVPYNAKEQPADLVVDGKLQRFWFNFTYKPLLNDAGKVYGILNMAVDISAQVAARRQIEESALFIRSVIENSPIAKVVFRGEDLTVDIINPQMLELLGQDASIIGRRFLDALPELRGTALPERLRHVYQTGEIYYQPEERVVFWRGGERHTGYYNYIYKPLRDTTGAIYGIITTATDVTEQVEARKTIEEAQAALRDAIDLAELGTWKLDLEANRFQFSPRVEGWYGIVSGGPLEALQESIPEEDRLRVQAVVEQAMTAGDNGTFDIEHAIVHRATGRRRVIHAQGRVQVPPGQRPVLEGIAQDITLWREAQTELEAEVQTRTEELAAANEELRATNDELAERTEELAAAVEELRATNEELQEANVRLAHSNDELSQYAYVASHDLQEPLRKIQVFSSMLSGQKELPGSSQATVQKIRSSAERMSLLIRDLLDFSRLLKSDALMQPVSLATIIRSVWDDFELQIAERHATLTLGELPLIEAVSLQMNQLFYNLLSNALKFILPDVPPKIVVGAVLATQEDVQRHVLKPVLGTSYYDITFQDNGIGFEAEYAEQIFEVFKRLHGREFYPGSGIGLALCRRILANHHGAIYAESAPGKGAIFHVLLPDRQPKAGV